MILIEPCCTTKHWMAVRDSIGKNGTTLFEGYGDLSLAELLPAILTRYSETEMMLVAPSIPDQAASALKKWMRKQWARMDGKGKLDVISRLTIIADLSQEASPMASAWLTKNPFPGRLYLCDLQQSDTVILLPDLAIAGPVNMRYLKHFIATATTRPAHVSDLWARYRGLAEQQETGTNGGEE